MQYIGKIYVGSKRQEMRVIWDTGSDFFLLGVDYCDNCKYEYFRSYDSETFQEIDDDLYVQSFVDGSYLVGSFVRDQVCITRYQDSCAADFDWIAVTYESAFRDIMDGIIGLSSGGDGEFDALWPHVLHGISDLLVS